MGLFSKKPKIVREIHDGAWGFLVQHGLDVDTLSKDVRCVERPGRLDNNQPATFMRVFKLSEASEKGIEVAGWETFDQHPELMLFEGYLTHTNEAHLDRKKV